MFYYNVMKTADPARTAGRLLALKTAMKAAIPPRSVDTTLLATWNIREFDSEKFGARSLECFYYIAEICSGFDLIAIQEVREKLDALDTVRNILGGSWKYIVSDVTEGPQGNRERMAFLYDSNKVRFTGLAGEVVIPPVQKRVKGEKVQFDPARQLYRTPFLVGFRSGWTTMMLCTVHIQYGGDQANSPERAAEIKAVAGFLAKRATEPGEANLILLGDFNIYDPKDITMKAMTDAGFVIPPELQTVPPTNTGKEDRRYDQIAFMPQRWRMETTGRAGVFNYYETVYRDTKEDEAVYAPEMGDGYAKSKSKHAYYRSNWRTYQMSDHLPMWIEIKSDYSEDYLGEFIDKGGA